MIYYNSVTVYKILACKSAFVNIEAINNKVLEYTSLGIVFPL
jgi:hypothetical protein